MKILYICDEYPPGKIGGIGSSTHVMAEQQVKNGHRVFVTGLYPHGFGGKNVEEQNGVHIWRLRYNSDSRLLFRESNSLLKRAAVKVLQFTGIMRVDARRSLLRLLALIREIHEREKLDVIEMPDWNDFFFHIRPSDLAKLHFPVPLVVKTHGSLTFLRTMTGGRSVPRITEIENVLFEKASRIIAISRFVGSAYAKLFSIEDKLEVIANGIAVRPLNRNEPGDHFSVLYSGSLSRIKGVYSLIRAWNVVVTQIPNARLALYGKGNQKPLHSLLSDAARPTVVFHGHTEQSILIDALRKSHVAVYPSFAESFGLAAVEAMAAGCAVVLTNRTTGPELAKDGKEALLVDPSDHKAIAAAIIRLSNDSALREHLGNCAHERAKTQYDISIVAEKHIGLYRLVIESDRA